MDGVPFKVKAVYEYASQETDDLSFPLGQIITVTEEIDADWYEGEYTDVTGVKKAGIFPNNFVERYEPEVPNRPTRPQRPVKEEVATIAPVGNDDTQTARQTAEAQDAPAASKSPPPAAIATEPPKQTMSPKPVQAETMPLAEVKKAPPVAPKSNAFKDRIAAFNAPAAAPILPFQPSRGQPPSSFIKKPYVAPPPSKDAYIPPPKQETVVKPYVRGEDPEIRQRQEEDQAAAQAAGLMNEDGQEGDEDAPKPQSLKDRIAMLQKQQAEQAMRRSEAPPKKEKKTLPPSKKTSQGSQPEAEQEASDEEHDDTRLSRVLSPEDIVTTTTRLPSTQRRPQEPIISSPPVPQHEILSGGEEADQSAAEETTDDAGTIGPDDSPIRARTMATANVEQEASEGEADEEEEEGEGEEMDEESRRKLELRERMAKMSGGMGMGGMLGMAPMPPFAGGVSAKKRAPIKRSTEDSLPPSSPPIPPQRMPMIPVPGLASAPSPRLADDNEEEPQPRRSMTKDRGAPPPLPSDRPAPPMPALLSRPTDPGYESGDDADPAEAQTPNAETLNPIRSAAPPVPRPAETPSDIPDIHPSRQSLDTASRPPPPLPPTAVASPPVPAMGEEKGESEYEGDYDTDIASSAKRKDALKGHAREPSYDDSVTTNETPLTPPPALPEYARPPPPPPQAARPSRTSTELPRAPPPIPPAREPQAITGGDDYDPYNYTDSSRAPPPLPVASPGALPPVPPPREPRASTEDSSDDLYSGPPPPRKPTDRKVPPPPPSEPTAALPVPPRVPPRQSVEIPNSSVSSRRSMDQSRPSMDNGQMATDLDLGEATQWWTGPDPLPPVLQERRGVDILSESEESSTSKRGGRTTISKDIYVLFLDYSQTVITARYDSREPADVGLEQRHEPSPSRLRQDQLESMWHRFGARIAETVNGLGNSKKDAAIGDGSSASLVYELIKQTPDALLPVGTRAYGAPVYANLANASVMQFDEIRAGDIVTLRNAKFEGKHSSGLHQKYRQETGALHVAVVHEWDGTKKKVRVWEQGREKKGGLKSESFRLGDLKSGEVRVWRVAGRDWVGWDGNS